MAPSTEPKGASTTPYITQILVPLNSVVSGKDANITSYSTTLQVPSAKNNPFLNRGDFKQGTFYAVLGPILGAFLFFYLFGVFYKKLRARSNAKVGKDIEDEYEMNYSMLVPVDLNSSMADKNDDNASSYYFNHQRNKTLTDIPGMQQSESKSNKPNSNSLKSTTTNDINSPFYLFPEPSKSSLQVASSTTRNGHFHRRRTSSMVLDEFINTGELPLLEGEHNLTYSDTNQVENHSMYQSQNNSYVTNPESRNTSPVRYSRSCSPVRRG